MDQALPYASVNGAINQVFFDGRFAAQPVYLSMDNGIRDEIAALLTVDPETVAKAICESVSSTLPKKGDLYGKHSFVAGLWRVRGMQGPPPFTALLFMLASAAEQMEEEGSFASNNYYYRLSKITGRDREDLKGPMRATEPMWIALNDWLTSNNYALGRPTAFTNGSTWRYVDWPISQAIVRASDRERFHDLFERFGFSGSETVTRQEMAHYLVNWIPARAQNTRLKRAWDKKEFRSRVVEAAIAELSTWSSSGNANSSNTQGRTTRLSLVANIVPRFPRQVLELHLGYQVDQADPVRVSSAHGNFQIANEYFGTIATLVPSPFATSGDALRYRHVLEDKAQDRKFNWDPRLVIPFSLSSQGSAWIEATRVGFGTPHILLVSDTKDLPATVETFLADKVSKLPTRTIPAQLPGLPEGWVLYTNVQLKAADISPPNDDLECLVPVGAGTVLDFSGGLELLNGIYHSRARPVARMVAPSSPIRLDVVPLNMTTASVSLSTRETELSLSLSEVSGQNDGLRVNGYLCDELVESAEVLLRDANRATPLRRDGKGLLAHTSIISATPDTGSKLTVIGMSVFGERPIQAVAGSNDIQTTIPTGEIETSQDVTFSNALERHAPRKACIHLWPFEMVPDNTSPGTPFKSTCTHCKQTLIIIYRQRQKTSDAPVRKPVVRQYDLPSMPTREHRQGLSVNHGILIDALSCLGSGSWGKFESMLAALAPEPQYAREVAQNFAILGHLDLEQRVGSGAIRSWCVPPATINMTPAGRAFIAGFRSSTLLEEVGNLTTIAGARIAVEESKRGPSGIFIDGLSIDGVRDAMASLRDPHGRQVIVNEAPALSIARACLTLGAMEESLTPVSIGRARNLQKFNLTHARWDDVTEVQGIGCYRWNDGFQSYAFVGHNDQARMGSYQLTKLLAARAGGVRLHAYDAKEQAFHSSLGCEPPGLLSRALSACSGRLSTIGSGTTTYHGVTPEVAGIVLYALYGRD